MVRFSKSPVAVGEGRLMLKPLFASLFALALTMPGCGKSDAPPARPPAPSHPLIGQTAPEIDGIDLDGAPMKLSDFRGKVVALSFWANWCPPCRSLFPHEKELVEKFRDQPFVLLGVNGDETREAGKKAHTRNALTWRSFYFGDQGGPIPEQWSVGGWPTIYVIDATGKIRYRFEGPQPAAVDRAVNGLLRETAVAKKS